MSLRFPETVGGPECPAFIRFTPEKVEYGGKPGLNNVGRTPNPANAIAKSAADSLGLSGIASTVVDRAGAAIGGAVDGFITDAVGSVQGKINDVLGDFSSVVNIGSIGSITGAASGAINLFMPEGMAASQGVNYREGGGLLSTTLAGAIGRGETSMQDILKALSSNAKPLLKETAVQAVNALTDNAGTDIRAMTEGKVSNNFSFMFFDSVGHREFQFTFECVPANANEAKQIEAIVNDFIYYMLPQREEGDYIIPFQWKIEYVGAKMLQPKKCFLKNVDVTYNDGAGRALHDDEYPFKTSFTLSFVEIEPLYSEKP